MGGIHEVEEKAAKLAKEVAARKEDAKKVGSACTAFAASRAAPDSELCGHIAKCRGVL